jgi:hypothetical protein
MCCSFQKDLFTTDYRLGIFIFSVAWLGENEYFKLKKKRALEKFPFAGLIVWCV